MSSIAFCVRGSPCPPTPEPPLFRKVGKGDLRKLFRHPDVVLAASAVLGIPRVELGEPFQCVLPMHDVEPSAMFCRNRRGVIVYRDSHTVGCVRFFTLPEVYFARTAGEIRTLKGPTCAVWAMRLLVEAGVLPNDDVGLPNLPVGTEPFVHQVYNGLKLLLSLRWAYETGAQPTTFSHRFAAAWCGVSENTAGQAIRELLRLDVIRIVGYIPGPFGKRMALFAPGKGHDYDDQPPVPILALEPLIGGRPNDY